ncbi:hypothetical protein TrLO_g9710 [Triparma laevis f. longispina]|uniref:ERCC4 domain-containing protein n=1 Tax=Triparma laevis f. longispina TaxID=1714387 RepID=A0A9W7DY26_9STRA|nr:hypothetical protein TrLO_g9710 [Triparma laevis f. longispina]
MEGLIDLTSPASDKGSSGSSGSKLGSNKEPNNFSDNDSSNDANNGFSYNDENACEDNVEDDYEDDFGGSTHNDDDDSNSNKHIASPNNNNNKSPNSPSANNDPNNTSIFSDDDDLLTKPSYLTSSNINSKSDLHQKKATEKRALKELQKTEKKRIKETRAQEAGRYAEKEITCLIESSLVESDCGRSIVNSLQTSSTPYNICIQIHPIPDSIRWFQRPYTLGGATHMEVPGNIEAPLMSVVFWKPDKFLKLLRKRDLSKDDLPYLREWVEEVRKAKKDGGGRICVVLVDAVGEVNRKWKGKASARRQSGGAPTTEEELQDAIILMLIQFKIEVTLCRNSAEAVEFITDMTDRLCKMPYKEEVSELDCLKVLKKGGGGEEDGGQAWFRMVSQIQGVSDAKASSFVEHYPTMNSVYEAYEKCFDESEKMQMLEGAFGTKTLNTKLSSVIYKILMADEGLELL